MQLFALLSSLATFQAIRAHEGHEHGLQRTPETNEEYAAQHMATEHHIDSFDIKAFFHLHDLNRDGFWDREEIEAIYGVHHTYSQERSADNEEHQEKANTIVQTVLRNVDRDKDGKITPAELQAAGLNSLPNFKELGVEGHHYDVESEFFLHHEEVYHSTPDTQNDDSYYHPEDLYHFAMHPKIEAEEEARERRFQGLAPDESMNPKPHDHDHTAPVAKAEPARAATHEEASCGRESRTPGSESSQDAAHEMPACGREPQPQIPGAETLPPELSRPEHPHDDQRAFGVQEPPFSDPPPLPKVTFSRETPPEKLPPEVRFGKSIAEGRKKDEWGQGEDGYKRPKTPADKLRRNLPYKYKFRRNWGDF